MFTQKVELWMDVYPGQVSGFYASSIPPYSRDPNVKRYRFTVEVEGEPPTDLGTIPVEKVE